MFCARATNKSCRVGRGVERYSGRPRSLAAMHRTLTAVIFSLLTGVLAIVVWFYAPGSMCYRLQETYLFRAGDRDAKVRLAVMVPKSGSYQEVNNLKISWVGSTAMDAYTQVDVVKLEGSVSAGEEKTAIVSYDVVLRRGPARWAGPWVDFQLKPQPGIESEDAALMQTASRLGGGARRDDAYRIHVFTAKWLTWGGESGVDASIRLQSAAKANATRRGVCGQFANLMTALCRSSGIPAQSISGLHLPTHYPPFWSATRTWGSPAGAHAWVEFRANDTWELADPSAAYRMPFKAVSFGRTDGGYLSFGERIAQDRLLKTMETWAAQNGRAIGGMTGPLRFSATADAKTTLLPRGSVKVSWNSRWLAELIYAGVMLCGVFRVRLYRRRGASMNSAEHNPGDRIEGNVGDV